MASVPLLKTVVNVPLAASLATETTDKLVTVGSVLELQNAYMDRTGEVLKRNGSEVLITPTQATIPSGGTIPAPYNLAVYQDQLEVLGVPGPTAIQTWLPEQSALVQASPTSTGATSLFWGPVTTTLTPILANSEYQAASNLPTVLSAVSSCCQSTQYTLTAYELVTPTQSNVVLVVSDRSSGQQVASTTYTNCLRPKCKAVGNFLCCIFADLTNTTIQIAQLDTTNLGSAVPVLNNIGNVFPTAPTMIDVTLLNSTTLAFIFNQSSSNDVTAITWVPSTQTGTNTSLQDHTGTPIVATNALCWIQDLGNSGHTSIVTANSTAGVVAHWGFAALSGGTSNSTRDDVLDSSTVGKAAAAYATTGTPGGVLGVYDLACYTTSNSATGEYTCVYTCLNLSKQNSAVVRRAFRSGSSVTTGATYWANVVLASNWFTEAGTAMIVVGYPLPLNPGGTLSTIFGQPPFYTQTQPTTAYYLVRDGLNQPTPIATFSMGSGGGLPLRNSSLAPVSIDTITGDALVSLASILDFTEILSSPLVTIPVMGVSLCRIHATAAGETTLSAPIEAFGSLFLPGGTLLCWDGQTLGEAGYSNDPAPLTLVQSNGGGQLNASSTYAYMYQYCRATKGGRQRRSGFSAIGTVSTNGAIGNSVSVTGFMNTITGTGGWIEVFRGAANAAAGFQLCGTIPNNPTVSTFTFNDLLADSELGAAAIGGDGELVDNQPIPGASLVVTYQGRLWFVSPEHPQTLYYTDVDTGLPGGPNDGLVFSTDDFAVDVIDQNGPITGLQVMDTELVVFKKDAIYLVQGSGPDGNGAGATYGFQLIASGVGTSNAHSIVLAQDGTWFMSESERSGIMTLSRGLTVDYTGSGVRTFSGEVVTSAVVVPSQSQLRWYTSGGTTLVWDWISKIWTTFTGQPCASAVYYNGSVAYAPLSGAFAGYVLQETPGYYAEGTVQGHNIQVTSTDTATSTGFIFANAYFSSADVGRTLVLLGTTNISNDGIYSVTAVTNGTTIVTSPPPPLVGVLNATAPVYAEVTSGRIVTETDSPWLSLALLKGYERIYRMQGVGETAGAHALFARLLRGYNNADEVGFGVQTFTSIPDWTWELRPREQRMDAMRANLTVTDLPYMGSGSSTATIPVVLGLDGSNPAGNLIVTNAQSYKTGDHFTVASDTNGNNGTYAISSIVVVGGAPQFVVTPSASANQPFSASAVVTQTGAVLSAPTAGAVTNGLALVVGTKKGLRRVPNSSKVPAR